MPAIASTVAISRSARAQRRLGDVIAAPRDYLVIRDGKIVVDKLVFDSYEVRNAQT
jgi:hypothetical protein